MYFTSSLFLVPAALSILSTTLAAEVTTEYSLTHTCKRPTQAGDKISVHYNGVLSTGAKFDSSYDRGTPLSFTVGKGQVIKGWDEGLLGMCPGDKRKLTIPPEFGYGQRAMGSIPAGSTLVFDTELISIAGVDEEPKVVKEADATEAEKPVEEAAPEEDAKKDEL